MTHLPTDELSIGPHNFRDATVRRPHPNEPVDPGRPLAELLEDATVFHTLTYFAPPLTVGEAMYEGVRAGRLTVEHVFAGGLVEYLSEGSERPPPWHDYVEAGARVYSYDGHIPCNLFVVDETVFVVNDRPDGDEALESENEAVRAWALELIETYREDAERVDAEAFV